MLREVLTEAVNNEKDFRKKSVARQSNARLAAMLLVMIPLLGFTVYSWVARPAFIWGPQVVATEVEQDANVRMSLFVLGMRLDAYRESEGFYPASLDALGEDITGITYELVSDSVFELRAMAGRQPVVFRSDMSAEEYLGNTKEVISNRRKR